uniref:Homeobox domain-containing protein n=2 Tax=Aegilops tauschii subsp. strangulata TaxID=200361 RepID=A0A452ZS65_AEGTS
PRPLPFLDMELELSLGDLPTPVKANTMPAPATCQGEDHDDLALGLRVTATERAGQENQRTSIETAEGEDSDEACPELPVRASPFRQASAQTASANSRGFDVNAAVPVDGRASTARSLSPPSMHMEVPVTQGVDEEASEDEDNGGARVRKKLRLSKEQSAFLEGSFKEHSTLTLEQKSCLANRLSLRPRQVEVWFQNRRARTKLKQMEADCERLKRCCDALARENRKLQREVAELRASRAPYPLYNLNHHLPGFGAALPSCSSCDATTRSTVSTVSSPGPSPMSTLFPGRPHFGPFTVTHPVPPLRRQPSATL